MIVQIRIDIDDDQRNALARSLNPAAKKALASRADVTEYVQGCIAGLNLARATPPAATGHSRISQLIERARVEYPQYAGRTDSFLRGVVKVAYADELRGAA